VTKQAFCTIELSSESYIIVWIWNFNSVCRKRNSIMGNVYSSAILQRMQTSLKSHPSSTSSTTMPPRCFNNTNNINDTRAWKAAWLQNTTSRRSGNNQTLEQCKLSCRPLVISIRVHPATAALHDLHRNCSVIDALIVDVTDNKSLLEPEHGLPVAGGRALTTDRLKACPALYSSLAVTAWH